VAGGAVLEVATRPAGVRAVRARPRAGRLITADVAAARRRNAISGRALRGQGANRPVGKALGGEGEGVAERVVADVSGAAVAAQIDAVSPSLDGGSRAVGRGRSEIELKGRDAGDEGARRQARDGVDDA